MHLNELSYAYLGIGYSNKTYWQNPLHWAKSKKFMLTRRKKINPPATGLRKTYWQKSLRLHMLEEIPCSGQPQECFYTSSTCCSE